MPYPMQCALCGVVWHRETIDAAPFPDPPHNHTQADWDAYITANSLDPKIYTSTPIWLKIAGQTYPPLPDWPPDLGSPPPGYPPAGAMTMSQMADWKRPDMTARLRPSQRVETPPFLGPSTSGSPLGQPPQSPEPPPPAKNRK